MAWVTDPANELLLHLADLKGTRATNQYWIAPSQVDPAGGAAIAIANAVQGISNDVVSSVEILRRASQSTAVTPTSGPYPRSADKVKLEFAGADGSVTILEVPAPNEVILDNGTINVDPAQATFSAAITVLLANLKSSEGATLIALKKGYRRRPPRLKKQ
jgi:hypothetical protein